MPQRWDAQGNPIADTAAAQPTQRWDASGKPIAAPTTQAIPAAPTPSTTDPFGFSTIGTGGGPEAEMLRRHARSRAGKPELTEKPSLFSRETISQTLTGAGELAKGLGGTIKTLGDVAFGGTPGVPNMEQVRAARSVFEPQAEEWKKGGATPGVAGVGHYVAGAIPFVGPMAAQAGESWGQVYNDPSIVGRAFVQTAAALGPEFIRNFKGASNLVRTGDAITNGMTRLSKEQVRPTLQVFEDGVGKEVAQHAQAVIAADEARAARGQRVLVNTADAHKAAQGVIDSMKGYTPSEQVSDYVQGALSRDTLASAKVFTSDVGRTIGSLVRRGLNQDAKVLQALYDGMHEATQKHAEGIGQEYGRSWQQYIDVHAAHMERLKGILGDLQEGFDGPEIVNKLIDTSKANEFHQLVKEMKSYGIDTTALESAREYGYSLQDTFQRTSNLFFGKLRAMIKHPLAAAPAAIGAAEVARFSGLPGMSFALPLIVAGKVGGLLDLRQMKLLLKDIQEGQVRAGAAAPEGLVSPFERELPPPLPPPAGGGPAVPAGGGGFKGGINPQGTEAMTAGKQSTAASQEALVADLQRAAAQGTPEEQAIAKQRLAEMGEEEAAPKFGTRAEIASKLSKARQSRTSGVYGGKR